MFAFAVFFLDTLNSPNLQDTVFPSKSISQYMYWFHSLMSLQVYVIIEVSRFGKTGLITRRFPFFFGGRNV